MSLLNKTDITPDTEKIQQLLMRLLPPYRVLLHNDDVNSMNYVIGAISKAVPSISRRQATEIMWAAHTHGMALVIICPKEPAELYRDRLESLRLTSTIEPAH